MPEIWSMLNISRNRFSTRWKDGRLVSSGREWLIWTSIHCRVSVDHCSSSQRYGSGTENPWRFSTKSLRRATGVKPGAANIWLGGDKVQTNVLAQSHNPTGLDRDLIWRVCPDKKMHSRHKEAGDKDF